MRTLTFAWPLRGTVVVLWWILLAAPLTSWAQRLDPQLLVRWQTVPNTTSRAGQPGVFDVVASERLDVMRDGRLYYHRRDVAQPARSRDVQQRLTPSALRALHDVLTTLCALPPSPPSRALPGDVRVDVQWASLRGCAATMSAQRWRRGPTRRVAAHLDGLLRRARRP